MTGGIGRIGCAALLTGLVAAGSVFGQQTDPKLWDEIQALKKGQEEIKRQLQELKILIQTRTAAQPAAPDVHNVPVDLGSHPVKGESAAKITLIEFSDYQCPYCGRYTRDIEPQLQKEYVETGKVRYVFFDMPLQTIHASALKAAEAVRCAGEQGKYWEMHDRLFANQQALEPWSGHAAALKLDVAAFGSCMASGKFAAAIQADVATAQKLGVNGTPSFLVAASDPGNPGQVKGITLIRGAMPFAGYKQELDRALAGDKPAE